MLPEVDGLGLVNALRTGKTPSFSSPPSAACSTALRASVPAGDDYLAKPFAFAELAARVEALGHRVGHIPPDPILRVADRANLTASLAKSVAPARRSSSSRANT